MEENNTPTNHAAMGITPPQYQAAFATLEHAAFARQIEDIITEAKLEKLKAVKRMANHVPMHKRVEFWATLIGVAALGHGMFVFWVWPYIQANIPVDSPLANHF
ncbi:hypothetical protein SAMD00023353_2700400 [Rosellinia necatrix]|uniref:Uncharacterized protein n=1 Tax=Rosellinia necatrix TaxID=77044 RepID=A0A1S8A8P7_ROSNE|nr:hypothetical protein SAMD00023353_2700400 [Rosellinia necatrix]